MRTSKMKVLTNPKDWGITIIEKKWGVYRHKKDQTVLMSGELIRDNAGRVATFAYRQNDTIYVQKCDK